MENRIVTVDEAIRLLAKFKESGGQNVMIAEYDMGTGVSSMAIPTSVCHGIMLIKRTPEPILYGESEIVKSLQAKFPPQKIKTIFFG